MQRDPQLLITFRGLLACGLFAALTLAFGSPGTHCLTMSHAVLQLLSCLLTDRPAPLTFVLDTFSGIKLSSLS